MKTHEFNRSGRRISIACDDPVLAECYARSEFYEQPLLDIMERRIEHGGTWVDVGANVGNHSVFFAAYCAAKVVALEPVAENFELLERNMRANGLDAGHLLLAAGAGDASGSLNYDPPMPGKRWSQVELGNEGSRMAPIITIDSLGLTDVRVIKLDCEGMEPEAVIGAADTVKRCKPELFIEIWHEEVLDMFRDTLGSIGYTMVERYCDAPTYHFSASGKFKVTYTPPKQ